MSLEISLRYFEAKEHIVGKLLRAYLITQQSDGNVRFQEFFSEITDPLRMHDFRSRLRSCYCCLDRIVPDVPLLLKDDVGTNCSFHDLCLYQECTTRLRDGVYQLQPIVLGKPN